MKERKKRVQESEQGRKENGEEEGEEKEKEEEEASDRKFTSYDFISLGSRDRIVFCNSY